MSATSPASPDLMELVSLADQCVLCGLCLPACPTYRVSRTEAESPRGRVSLAKALAGAGLPATGSVAEHLDHCLGCLSCERACPSGVQYGRIIVAAKQLVATPPDRQQRLLYALAARTRWLRRISGLAQGLQLRRWLRPVLRRSRWGQSGVARALNLLPRPAKAPSFTAEIAAGTRGRIGLFLGCVASALDRDTHAAARTLLRAAGYVVVEPPGQACCGALARHAGHATQAQDLAAPTRAAFLDSGVDTVLVSASGCFGTLQDLTFAGTSLQVREIGEFLAADAAVAQLSFTPLDRRAALHVPCSLSNRVRAAAATRQLLQRIPALKIIELPDQPRCCGAGGSHMLRHGELADSLRDERVTQVRQHAADLLLTSNIGCRLHLGAGLDAAGTPLEVLHPIALLARQLKAAAPGPTATV